MPACKHAYNRGAEGHCHPVKRHAQTFSSKCPPFLDRLNGGCAARTRTASDTTAAHPRPVALRQTRARPKSSVWAHAQRLNLEPQSYDHHHKKRFADFQREAKAMKGGPSKDERQRKEQKRLEKEMAARAEALKQAASSSSSTSGAQPPPPPPPPPPTASGDVQPPAPPPPDAQPGGELPQGGGSLKIGFSMKPLSGGGKKPAGMVMKKPAGAAKRPAAMAFGDDSD